MGSRGSPVIQSPAFWLSAGPVQVSRPANAKGMLTAPPRIFARPIQFTIPRPRIPAVADIRDECSCEQDANPRDRQWQSCAKGRVIFEVDDDGEGRLSRP